MQLTTQFTEQLKTVLNEEFDISHHTAIKEFFEKVAALDLYTEEQLEQLLTSDAIAVYDEYFFDRFLAESYSKDFDSYAPGQYDTQDSVYKSLDGSYIIEQQIF